MTEELESYPRWFGRYLLLKNIGAGGFGVVHLAAPAGEDELLVVKTLRAELLESAELRARFQHEIALCGRLVGPHFVRLREAGAVGGTPYLAMEYVDGCSLRSLLRRAREAKRLLRRADGAHLARGLLASVAALHELRGEDGERLQIVHRDLSPSNLMLDAAGQVRLIDLGVGRSELAENATRTGQVLGSLGYMSPEQVRARRVNQASDQFSCAVILWEIFAGARLIPVGNAAVALMRTARLKYPPLRKKHPALPEALDHALARAMARAPEERFPSVLELLRALEPVWPELPPDAPGATGVAELYRPQQAREELEALRALAREADPPPGEQPTIFATWLYTPSAPPAEPTLAVTSYEVMGYADTPVLARSASAAEEPTVALVPEPTPLPAPTPLVVPPGLLDSRPAPPAFGRFGGWMFSIAVIALGLALGLQLAKWPARRVTAVVPSTAAVKTVPRPQIEQAAVPPEAPPEPPPAEAPAPAEPPRERSTVAPAARAAPAPAEPPRERSTVAPAARAAPAPAEPPAAPRPAAGPTLEGLIQEASRLRARRPELIPELDLLLGELALEGRRQDPARLGQIAGRLAALAARP